MDFEEINNDLRIFNENISLILNEYFDCSIDKICNDIDLYHYTSLGSLINIIEENELWISDREFLNDKLEVNYASKVIENSFSNSSEKNKMESLKSVFFPNKEYLLCMTTERDLIHLWQYYGTDDGYAIKFDSEKLINHINISNYKYVAGSILYDPEKQKSFLNEIINKIIEVSQKFSEIGGEYANYFGPEQALAAAYSLIKSEHHNCEKEFRFSFYQPSYGEIEDLYEEEYRSKKGIIVPYFKYSFDKIPIKEIVIGPNIDHKIAEKSLRLFLDKNGFEDVEIGFSNIQIR